MQPKTTVTHSLTVLLIDNSLETRTVCRQRVQQHLPPCRVVEFARVADALAWCGNETDDRCVPPPDPAQIAAEMALRVGRSLELEDILQAAVEEIQRWLEGDRVAIVRYDTDGSTRIVAAFPQPQIADTDLTVPLHRSDARQWGAIRVGNCPQQKQRNDAERAVLHHFAVHLSTAIDRAERVRDLETRNRQLQERLHRSQQRVRTLIDNFPEGAVLLFDRHLRYQAVGGWNCQTRGFQKDELEGKTIWDVLPPDTCAAIEPLYRQALAGDRACDDLFFGCRHYNICVVPIGDENEPIEAGVAIVRDLTEHRAAQTAARNSQAFLRLVLDTVPQPIFWKDRDGRFLGCNRKLAELAGRDDPDDLVGASDFDCPWYREAPLYRADDLEIMASGRDKLHLEEPITIVEGRGEASSRQTRWIRTHKVPLLDPDGNIIGILGTFEDITDRKHAEEHLRQNETLLQETQRLSRVGGWSIDLRAGKVIWTEEMYRIHELPCDVSPHPLLDIDRLLEFYPDEARDTVCEAFALALESGRGYDLEVPFLTATGRSRWVRTTARVVCENGQPVKLIGAIADITDRKQAELALQDLNRTLESQVEQRTAQLRAETAERSQLLDVLEASLNEIYIIDAETLQFRYVNRGALQNLGYTAEEMARASVLDITPHFTRDRFRQHVAPLVDGRVPQLIFETVHQRADGSTYPVDVRLQPIEQSGTSLFLAIALDISSRKAAEDALRTSQQRYALATRAARVGIWEWNLQTGEFYLDPNVKALLGYEDDEIPNDIDRWMQYVYPDDRDAVMEAATACFDGRTPEYVFEHRMVHKDGSLRWILVRGRVWRDASGTLLKMMGTDTDITDRKQAELALQASEARFQRIAANAPGVIYQFVRDLEGRQAFLYVSDRLRDLLELDPEGVCRDARTLFDRIHPDDRPSFDTSIDRSVRTRSRWHWEGRFIAPSGRLVWIQGLSEPERQPDGSLVWDGMFFDITARKATDAALKESEAKFRQLAETIEDVFSIVTPGFEELLYVSPSYERLWGPGYPKTQEAWEASIHPDDRDRVLGLFKSFNGGTLDEEYRIVRSDGQLRWIRDRAFPVTDETGQIDRIVGVAEDITDRKHVELDLVQNRDLREAIFNESTDALFLVDPDSLLTVDCNRRALELFEAESKWELVGLEGNSLQRYPFAPEEIRDIAREIRDRGFWSREIEYVTCRGRYFWGNLAAKTIEVAGTRFNLVRVSDISDRKTAEVQLRKSQARLLSAQRIACLGSWEYHLDTGQIEWSEETFRIFKRDLHRGAPTYAELDACIHPDDRPRHRDTVEQAVAAQQSFAVEYRFYRDTGELGYLSARGEPIFDANGQLWGFLGTVLDITDRKGFEETLRRTNAELARATRLKDEFLANMSHELRTPLNAILGISEGLLEQVYGALDDREIKAIGIIERSGRHLLELINDILDLSKIEAGHLELHRSPTTLLPLCESSLSFVKQMAAKKNIHLHLEVRDNSVVLDIDERRMRQVLVNLLSNAVKFTPEGGRVSLDVSLVSESSDANDKFYAVFAVSDTGIGIAPEDCDRLFEPFVQIDSRLCRTYRGTGLGLSLVKRLTELHGGRIEVDSRVGGGSCFTVWIPAQISQGQRAIEEEDVENLLSSSPSIPDVEKPLVLLAEDHKASAEMLVSFLCANGYRTAIAQNGLDAFRQTKQHRPDVILMDVQMPLVDGLEAIARIRGEADIADVPIVALTALAMAGDRDRCLEAGADDYIPKPVRLKLLLETLERLLSPTAESESIL
ncbi:Circadian input kinase A [Geitlerinema sp. FC II]|nr:Circadian input kinase A [Geitlerinema sp. FC II]